MSLPNVSEDLIWEVVRTQNAFLVKRSDAGGVQFSRDPLNLTNKHTRKHAGFVNSKAIGISAGENGAITVTTKNAKKGNQPAKSLSTHSHGSQKSTRKIFKSVANQTAKTGYRADLRSAAVERVSAIRRTQKPVKASPEKKLRGNAAKKAAAEQA